MKRSLALCMALAAALALSACGAGSVTSKVTTFHGGLPVPQSGSFALVAAPEQEQDLEFRSYAQHVAQGLAEKGLRPVDEGARPDYLVSLNYGMDEGRRETWAAPVYGQPLWTYPYVAVPTRRTKDRVVVSPVVPLPPVYGAPVYPVTPGGGLMTPPVHVSPYGDALGVGVNSATIYTRWVQIEMAKAPEREGGQPVKVFEARAMSEGSGRILAKVVPAMIRGALENYPGTDGEVRKVTIDTEQ